MLEKICEQCGKTFQAKANAKTCSDACRAKRSRRNRDPEIGSPERKQSQLAGLNVKYTYRQRGQVRYDLQRLGLVPSERTPNSGESYGLAGRYPGGGALGKRAYMGGGSKPFMAFRFQEVQRQGDGWIVDGRRYRKASLPSAELDTFYIGGQKFSRKRIQQLSVTEHTQYHQQDGDMNTATFAQDIAEIKAAQTELLDLTRRIAERLNLSPDDERVKEAVEQFIQSAFE